MPALDGLRGLAVVAVVAFHLWPTAVPGGFLGVDLFFALSGFLITSLLLEELDHAHRQGQSPWRGLPAFWARRARRLLPALLVLILVVTISSRFLLPTWQLGNIRSEGFAALAYVSNWREAFHGVSYFESAGSPSPFAHLWSLAIEEQLYLVWPALLVLAWRLSGGRRGPLAVAIGSLAVGSAAAMALTADRDLAYYATHTRAQALLAGAVLAAVRIHAGPRGRRGRLARWRVVGRAAFGVVGLCGLVAMAFTVHGTDGWLYRGGFTLAAALAAMTVAAGAQVRSPFALVLAASPLRLLGRVSYGCYLVHWPVIVFVNEGRTGWSGWRLDGLRLGATAALTALSYAFVERPIRAGRWRGRPERVGAPVGVAAALVVVVLVGGAATEAPFYLRQDDVAATAAAPRITPARGVIADAAHPGGPPGSVTPALAPSSASPVRRITLLGDSVAASLAPSLAAAASARGITFTDRSVVGCGVVINTVAGLPEGGPIPYTTACPYPARAAQEGTPGDRPDLVLVLSTWEGDERYRREDDRTLEPGTDEWRASVEEGLAEAVERASAGGAAVELLLEPPRVPGMGSGRPGEAERARAWAEVERSWAQRNGVAVTDLGPIVCAGRLGECPARIDGVRLRPDDGRHFTAEGAAVVGAPILDAVLQGEAAHP